MRMESSNNQLLFYYYANTPWRDCDAESSRLVQLAAYTAVTARALLHQQSGRYHEMKQD